MASGPLPKSQHSRERDSRRRTAGATSLVEDGVLRGPDLVGQHEAATLAWYDDWRRSAQAQTFTRTDWRRLAILAGLVDSISRRPTVSALGELRLQEERLGATVGDRLRLRMKIDTEAPVAPVASIAGARSSARDRLAGLNAEDEVDPRASITARLAGREADDDPDLVYADDALF